MRGRPGARRLAVTNAGTIPDRGLYGVHLADGGGRVGELDEEMVYEARAGQTFLLGASTWRIEEITRDRVLVSPAPGVPGAVPFWKGEGVGRPYELGAAIGAASRELVALSHKVGLERLQTEFSLDERAASNLLTFLGEQAAATGAVPSDRTIVVERFRDEIGDWRICILTPFGARVHAPWAMAIAGALPRRARARGQAIWSDDGIALHLPDADAAPPTEDVLVDPDEVEELVIAEVGETALFGARFRENAGRSLLIPRRRPGERTPLWQQRLKSQSLLQVARRYRSFPVVLETYRECLQDVFDLPALKRLLQGLRTRELDLVDVETPSASPYSASLLFDYVANYMYEDDTPRGRAARPGAVARPRPPARAARPGGAARPARRRCARGGRVLAGGRAEERRRAPRQAAPARRPASGRSTTPGSRRRCCASGGRSGCASRGRSGWSAAEDAGRYRDALGVDAARRAARRLPFGVGHGGSRCDSSSTGGRRGAGPFTTAQASERFGRDLEPVLAELERDDKLVRGELRPGGTEREWCDPDVLRRIRRASLAALRKEVEPAEQAAFARFLPSWHGVDRRASLREALVPLQGLALPVSLWESEVLPAARARLPARAARPALRHGRGRLGRRRGSTASRSSSARTRRFSAAPRAAGAGGRGARRDPRRARLERRVLVRPARRDRPRGRRRAARALGPRLGRRGDERRVDAAPRQPRRFGAPQRRAPAAPVLAPPLGGDHGHAGPLVARPRACSRRPPDRRALAELLLERQGIVTRDGVRGEGIPGGYGAVYGELKALETLGLCRRGYFVEGLGGAQFALGGAVERLRELRPQEGEEPEPLVLAAADPAQPYGAALPWPKRAGAPRRPGRGSARRPTRRRAGAVRRSAAAARSCRSATLTGVAAPGAGRARRACPPRPARSALRWSASTASRWSRPSDGAPRRGRLPGRASAGRAAPVTLFELQRRSYERAGPAVLGSWPPEQAMSEEQLERYLDRRRFCVLATATPSGTPQARPVAFVRLDGALWFATVDGARLRNVRANDRVSVVIEQGDRDEHAMVLLEGRVTIHEDDETRERFKAAWSEQQGGTAAWAAAFLELQPARVFSYVATAAKV